MGIRKNPVYRVGEDRLEQVGLVKKSEYEKITESFISSTRVFYLC